MGYCRKTVFIYYFPGKTYNFVCLLLQILPRVPIDTNDKIAHIFCYI